MAQTVKEKIIAEYGTINNFVEKRHSELTISRTHLYKLIEHKVKNPTVQTLSKLALLLNMKKEDVIAEYCDAPEENENADSNAE